jgi:hypothetical protein
MMTLQQQMAVSVARKIVKERAKHPKDLVDDAHILVDSMGYWEGDLAWPSDSPVWKRFTKLLPVDRWPEICTDTDKCP